MVGEVALASDRARGLVFVLSGPAGAGKTELMRELKAAEPDVHFCITATTREPRAGEQHGVDYFFYSVEEFERLRAQNGLLEWANIPPGSPKLYGTPKAQIEHALEEGRDVFLQVDVQGARSVRQRIPNAILIFLKPESVEILRRRLLGRGTETTPDMESRLANAVIEMRAEPEFDHVVVNVEQRLAEAVAGVRRVMAEERHRIPPRVARIDPPDGG
jgi:guanylate kinase